MRALVTGGGGFLGGAIVRMLRERGDDVTVFGRSRYPHIESLGVPVVRGDLRDRAAVEAAVSQAEVVFHVGGITRLWGDDAAVWSINLEGTRNVLAACRAGPVRRLIYTSSPSVVSGRDDLCGVDESVSYPKRFLAAYPASKAAAEREVLDATDDRLATISLRPHLVWGPGDPHLIPRVLDRARRGRLIQVGDGSNEVDVTYVDNAAEAHLLAASALEPGAPCAGRAYFISQGQPVALWPWLNGILEAVGIAPVRRSMSFRTAYRLGWVCETAYGLLRRGPAAEPPMTRFLATQLGKTHYFNIAAARKHLAYTPRISMHEGMSRLLASLDREPGGREGNGPPVVDHAGPRRSQQPQDAVQ
jgi:nucleoside-diphosphate-sugar epimerase